MRLMYDGFHIGSVDSMDCCLHRPLIATLEKQKSTVKIWNYKNPENQLTKVFDPKIDGIE
jgi:hypothetical protein